MTASFGPTMTASFGSTQGSGDGLNLDPPWPSSQPHRGRRSPQVKVYVLASLRALHLDLRLVAGDRAAVEESGAPGRQPACRRGWGHFKPTSRVSDLRWGHFRPSEWGHLEGSDPYFVMVSTPLRSGHWQSRTRLRSSSKLARPYVCRLIILSRLTLPSTTPEFQGMVRPLRTAAWSRLRPRAKECRSGWSSASTAVIQSSRRSPCRPVRILANSVTWPASASRCGQRSRGPGELFLFVVAEVVRVGEDPAGEVAGLGRAGDGGRGGAGLAERQHVVADGAVAARVAAFAELGVQLADVGAALVPPLVQVGLVVVQQRWPSVPDLGEQLVGGGGAVEAADGLLGQAGLAHDRLDALALGAQRLDLLIPLAGAHRQGGLLRPPGGRRCCGLLQVSGGLAAARPAPAPARADGFFQAAPVAGHRLLHVLGQVVVEMPPVGDLGCFRGALAGAVGVGAGPVPADHLGSGVLLQPVRRRWPPRGRAAGPRARRSRR